MLQRFKSSLFLQVIFALILGIIIGISFHDFSLALKPLGDGFIALIKMLIAPIVFCVVVFGLYGANDLKKMGKVGAKTILYFEIVTSIALVLGIVIAYVFKPGIGMNIDITAVVCATVFVMKSMAKLEILCNVIVSVVVKPMAQLMPQMLQLK